MYSSGYCRSGICARKRRVGSRSEVGSQLPTTPDWEILAKDLYRTDFGNSERSSRHESFSQHHESSCISGSVLEAACIAKARKFDSGMRKGVECLLLDSAAQSINKSSGSIQLTTALCSTTIFYTLVYNITAIIATGTSPRPFLPSSLMPCAISRVRTLSSPEL